MGLPTYGAGLVPPDIFRRIQEEWFSTELVQDYLWIKRRSDPILPTIVAQPGSTLL
jgi:hypothetical protein